MNITLSGFKYSNQSTIRQFIRLDQTGLTNALQNITNKIASDTNYPAYWSMCEYKTSGKHNANDVVGLTGIMLEYYGKGVNLVNAGSLPYKFCFAETVRDGGNGCALFFPLDYLPSSAHYFRIAGVLAKLIDSHGLVQGSGTPTFLVRLKGGQTIAEHDGAVIDDNFVRMTKDVQANTALKDYVGAPVAPAASRPILKPVQAPATQTKSQQIAAQFRVLADLFDAE